MATFAVLLAVFRIVSLSSMVAASAVMIPAFSFELPLPYLLLVVAAGFYVILLQRANSRRLLAGTEPRLGKTSAESKADSRM